MNAVCARRPTKRFKPGHTALRREPMGVLIMVAMCFEKVKEFTLRAADPGFDSSMHFEDFSESSHTSDLEIGTPVATLPGTWYYRVSFVAGWPSVSTL